MQDKKHPKLDWWLSVRDQCKTEKQKRNGDILFGVFKPFRFPKTHRKLVAARHKKKIHKGLKIKALRFSHRLKIDGARAMRFHYTPYYKTVRGILWHHKVFAKYRNGRPYPREVKYARRWKLVLGPRADRLYRKYGPCGG